ncbi:MAG TPA: hypothetical protein VK973_12025 [Arenicellales bacterium]|nr:hypothetical protein [Arenicellales bacterium]
MAGGAHCLSCGQPLSRYAAKCPRCGAPQPHKRIGSTVGLVLMLVLLAGVVLWALLGGR